MTSEKCINTDFAFFEVLYIQLTITKFIGAHLEMYASIIVEGLNVHHDILHPFHSLFDVILN
jgi:hypothetical protein